MTEYRFFQLGLSPFNETVEGEKWANQKGGQWRGTSRLSVTYSFGPPMSGCCGSKVRINGDQPIPRIVDPDRAVVFRMPRRGYGAAHGTTETIDGTHWSGLARLIGLAANRGEDAGWLKIKRDQRRITGDGRRSEWR